MIFLSNIFLWSIVSLGVPVLLAIWSRRQRQPKPFGAFFILNKLLQSHVRRWRISELLKLLNRLILLACLVFVFANPQVKEIKYMETENGFALILDVGRAMQANSKNGELSAKIGYDRLIGHLKKLPEGSRGVVLFASDRCQFYGSSSGLVRQSEEFVSDLRFEEIPFANAPTTAAGLQDCFSKIGSVFGHRKIFTTFVSPFPDTLDENKLIESGMAVDQLEIETPHSQPIETHEVYSQDKVRVEFRQPETLDAILIRGLEAEKLGRVTQFLDLANSGNSWLLLKGGESHDPWSSQRIIGIRQQKTYRLTLWAEKESPGFLSLYSALKNFPELAVLRQVGGEPPTEPVIVYGNPPQNFSRLKQVWIFLDPQSSRPFSIRDQKIWTSQSKNTDVEKAFHIQTQDGRILIKRYLLLDIERIQSLEAFEDGAPSLMSDAEGRWISPFDLEDLTTDLTLEATFIPYLYRKLDQFLMFKSTEVDQAALKPIWLMPGGTRPTREVLESMRWPGVYVGSHTSRIVQPVSFPEKFYHMNKQSLSLPNLSEQWISIREWFLVGLVISVILELLFCLYGTFRMRRFVSILLSLMVISSGSFAASGESEIRPIALGVMKGMDPDRLKALEQTIQEFGHLSNLEFAKPKTADVADLWKYAVVVISSTRAWGPFSNSERESIREYLERGGFFVFDDPMATSDSTFHQSVNLEFSKIFPGRVLSPISKEDVVFRAFYLMTEVSGRKLASPHLEGLSFDRRWAVVFSFNDLLGALLRSANGDYAFSVTPYGISQRTLAKRLFLNLMMYSVTLDYKDDAIHLPHILKRRVK